MAEKFNQLKFAIAILQKLAERPYAPNELCETLYELLESHDQSTGDISRKVSRMIGKMRDCGFEIHSAPNRPYKLVTSTFPIILTPDQRKALALAAHMLDNMGFSAQGGQIFQMLGFKFKESKLPAQLQANFSPPVDYSEEHLETTVQLLQDRFQKRRRYTIRYRSSRGQESPHDLDRSELRLHNGVLYLFAYTPDFSARHHSIEKNQIFRVDRIQQVGPASDTPWGILRFPTIDLNYRMSGPLGNYQPRRDNEKVLSRDSGTPSQWVEIVTTEESIFWFKQRLFQYRSNIKLLSPLWVVEQVAKEMFGAAQLYWPGLSR